MEKSSFDLTRSLVLYVRRMSRHLSAETRRQQLIKAGIVTFGRKGYHQTQVSDIIKQAKVARGTFYLYFKAKREIFDVIMSELFSQVSSEIKTLPRHAIDKIPEQLLGNLERVTNLLWDYPLLSKILFNESVGLDPDLDKRLKKFYGQILDYIRRGLKQGQEMGFVREGNVSIMSLSLLGSFKEIFYQKLLGTPGPDKNQMIQEVYQFVICAIIRPDLKSEISQ